MTTSLPFDTDPSIKALRKLWLNPYVKLQAVQDSTISKALANAAQDAYDELVKLDASTTFSQGVKNAQLRIVVKQVAAVLKDVFNDTLTITTSGQKNAAILAVDKFAETDKKFLSAAFKQSGDVDSFIAGQETSAQLGIAHAISSITKANYKLSTNVYRSEKLANNWVKTKVNSIILRNGSAKDIATAVQDSIKPTAPGGASYAALRLGRTELNNAFHATSVSVAQNRPWVQNMGWYLSATHIIDPMHPEICEQYSRQNFTVDKVPPKPHPQCRCYVAPKLISYDAFLANLTAGQYSSWTEGQNQNAA
jgi:hypothetical protein